jgi:tetratricopeptide (TPR) repeat protein
MPTLPPPSLTEAIAHHRRGELEPAERIYRAILTRQPNDPEALHLLGVLVLQRGQPRQAVELIERAIAGKPAAAVFHGNLGEAYRACGELPRAAASYQTALRLQPEAADVALNLGTLLMQVGRPTEAMSLFHHALVHQPNFATAHNNLGNAYRALGQVQPALACYRRAVELDPRTGYLHGNLGQMLLDCGQLREALFHCHEAVRLEPDSAPAHNNLGNVYRKLEQHEQARGCYAEALRLAPNLPVIHDNLGRTLYDEDKHEAAADYFQQALRLAPNTALFHLHLGEALTGLRRFAEAETHLRAALTLEPGSPRIRYSIAWMHYEQGRLEEAQAEYRSILREHPDHVIVNQHLGEVLIELNQMEEALACFRAARCGNPKFAPALAQLATHLRDKLPADERQALLQLSADAALPERDRVPLLYGLAQVCDAGGEHAEAAKHLERANALEFRLRKERGQDYHIDAHTRFVDRLLTVFTPKSFERVRGFGLDSERPVFIVGLPRSGTTLLEQVLASHSRVFAAGELFLSREGIEKLGGGADGRAEMRALDALESIDAAGVRGLARTHLDRLEVLSRDAERIIDKMPDNYLYLGYLATLFPKARFLHCRRDLRDVAVSCWITQFRLLPWANDLEQIASRFAQYQRVMEHWRRVLPVPLLEVDYEDMVENLEAVARRVVSFCGLEWEEACLQFHRTRRAIRTASATQVRQPIYRRSVGRWRNYQKPLRPLFARLGFADDSTTSKQTDDLPAEVGAV